MTFRDQTTFRPLTRYEEVICNMTSNALIDDANTFKDAESRANWDKWQEATYEINTLSEASAFAAQSRIPINCCQKIYIFVYHCFWAKQSFQILT